MLVLSRKQDESIVIGDNIEVTVLQVNPHRVRIGIKAPKSVKVLRSELVTFSAVSESNLDEEIEFAFDLPLDDSLQAGRSLVPK